MKIALAMAGGGVKGAAHIGLIKALQEENIEISSISGTSIGSIVAALYALGYTPEEMLRLFKYFAKELFKADGKYLVNNMKQRKGIIGLGAWSGQKIEDAITQCAKMKEKQNLADLEIPVRIPTVDILNGEKYVCTNYCLGGKNEIQDISIGKAVRASASYPRGVCTMHI